jgi:hypothetical protein
MKTSEKTAFAPSRNIDSIIAALIGFGIIQAFAWHSGIGVSPDSVTYISAARNFSAGHGLIQFDHQPLIVFPACYPLFLGTISFITRLDPLVFGAVLNGLLFAIVIYLSGSIMNQFSFTSKWYKRILLSCFALSPSLLEVYSMLWSETLFILLLFVFIILFKHYLKSYSIRSLLLASFIAALACITRYAGVTLIGTGALLLLLDRHLQTRKKINHLLILGTVSCSLLLINLIRNSIVSETLTGMRQKGTTTFVMNMHYFGSILSDWLPVPKNNMAVAFTLAYSFGIVCIGLFIIAWKHFRINAYETIAAAFSVVYPLFMMLSATISRYEQFTNRLLSPLFIPLIWTISWWLPWQAGRLAARQRKWIIAMAVLITIGFQYNQLATDYETYDGVKDAGIPGYTEDPFPQSGIVQFIRKNTGLFKPGYTIYSNAGDAVYFFTGLYSDLLPQKVFPQEVERYYAEQRDYLVWFNDVDNPDLVALQDILKHKKMTLIRQFDEGAVYVSEGQ